MCRVREIPSSIPQLDPQVSMLPGSFHLGSFSGISHSLGRRCRTLVGGSATLCHKPDLPHHQPHSAWQKRAEDTRPYLGVYRQETGRRQLDSMMVIVQGYYCPPAGTLIRMLVFDLAIIIGRHRDARVSELFSGNNWQIIESYYFYRTT